MSLSVPVNSFASKLLNAQREAGRILIAHLPELDLAAIQQSFLLRGGSFVGVRWQSGEWSVEWMLSSADLILREVGVQKANYPLPGEVSTESPVSLTSGTDAIRRRAA